MPCQVKFPCGHSIGVAVVDAEKPMVCPFCSAQPKRNAIDRVLCATLAGPECESPEMCEQLGKCTSTRHLPNWRKTAAPSKQEG